MSKTKIICWARTQYDSRDTASDTLAFQMIRRSPSAAKIATAIDSEGQFAVDDFVMRGVLLPSHANRPSSRAAVGHGVVVVYPHGARRTFRGQ